MPASDRAPDDTRTPITMPTSWHARGLFAVGICAVAVLSLEKQPNRIGEYHIRTEQVELDGRDATLIELQRRREYTTLTERAFESSIGPNTPMRVSAVYDGNILLQLYAGTTLTGVRGCYDKSGPKPQHIAPQLLEPCDDAHLAVYEQMIIDARKLFK